MTRYQFPEDNTSFLYTGPGEPIRQPWEAQLTIYTDATCLTPAAITDLDGNMLPGSVLFIGSDGLIPSFLGPDDGTLVLYAKPVEDPAYPLTARLDQYIDAKVLDLVGQAPDVLDTLGQIAAALDGDPHAFDTLAGMATQTLCYAKSGDLTAPYTSPYTLWNDSVYDWQIKSLRATMGTAPVGAGLTISLHRSDTSAVLATVSVADGATTGVSVQTSPYPVMPSGVATYLTVDQVGSTTPGGDLSLQMVVTNNVPQAG